MSKGSFTASVFSRSAIAIHKLAVPTGSNKSAAVTLKQAASTGYIGSIVALIAFLQFF